MVEPVVYAQIKREERVFWHRRWRYTLTRTEGDAVVVIVSGFGVRFRSAIGVYLHGVREIGGPDAAAAGAAIEAGWFTQVSP